MLDTFFNSPLGKGIKEFGRIALVGVIPAAIDQLQTGSINTRTLLIIGLIAVLKATDKMLHEENKTTKKGNTVKGLLPF